MNELKKKPIVKKKRLRRIVQLNEPSFEDRNRESMPEVQYVHSVIVNSRSADVHIKDLFPK